MDIFGIFIGVITALIKTYNQCENPEHSPRITGLVLPGPAFFHTRWGVNLAVS